MSEPFAPPPALGPNRFGSATPALGAVPMADDDAAARWRRLRWRARRGMLENDLVLERFFRRYEARLDDELVRALDGLLDLGDSVLLDLILRRQELEGAADTPAARSVLGMLRSA